MSICTKRTKKPLSYRGQVNIILLRRYIYIVCTELANLNRRVKCMRTIYMTPSSLSYSEICVLCVQLHSSTVVVTVVLLYHKNPPKSDDEFTVAVDVGTYSSSIEYAM